MISNRPYLIRAINEWLLDSQCTPHLLVNADAPGVDVPQEHSKDGQIVLNIGPRAVEGLQISNEEITFLARFSGVSRSISVPIGAVLAIYAKENGRGMMFNETDEPEPDDSGPKPTSRPSLKVVK